MKTAHMCSGDLLRIQRLLAARMLKIASMMRYNGENSPGCGGHEQWSWADNAAIAKGSDLVRHPQLQVTSSFLK